MEKVIKKIVFFINIIMCVSILFNINIVLGYSTDGYDGIYTDPGSVGNIDNILKTGLGVAQVIAGFVAVCSVIWLGVSFMKESPSGKAESKKKAVLILVGAMLVFGASQLVKMVAEAANAEGGAGTEGGTGYIIRQIEINDPIDEIING